MADLLTHALAGALITARVKRRLVVLAVVGGVLPDVISVLPELALRPLAGLTGFEVPSWWHEGLAVFHSPFVFALLAWGLVLFLPRGDGVERPAAFLAMTAGGWLHTLLDLIQRHIVPIGYYPGYPFVREPGELGFMWSEGSLYILPFLALAVFLLFRRRPGDL